MNGTEEYDVSEALYFICRESGHVPEGTYTYNSEKFRYEVPCYIGGAPYRKGVFHVIREMIPDVIKWLRTRRMSLMEMDLTAIATAKKG